MKFESVFIDQVEFHLALTHHVVLQPGNMGAELLLMDLERDGVLPKTVTWGNDDGSTSRLYRIANTRNVGGCYDINLGESRLVMVCGSSTNITMPPIQPTDSSSRWIRGRSLKEMEPAQFPVFGLSWLVRLAGITDCESRWQKAYESHAMNSS